MKVAPDVMILPSRLACLAKDISGTLAVNPGTLAKGSGGGTFAEITIHPIQESVLRETLIKANDASVEMTHQVPERSCVQIVKI